LPTPGAPNNRIVGKRPSNMSRPLYVGTESGKPERFAGFIGLTVS